MTLTFENDFTTAFLISSEKAVFLSELPDAGGVVPAPGPFDPEASNRFVQRDQPVVVTAEWDVTGLLAQLLPPNCTWKSTVYVDRYGGNNPVPSEYTVNTAHVQAAAHKYQVKVTVPANALAVGLYRLALSITFTGPAGQPLPPAGFAVIGNLHVYNAA